ncbi:ABC transporter substrate-binding protein [Microbacterium murale]|uniref:Multiple sugar transport system substrate-binding protein n=1 Tax=Microbacterium murale TaxID=1081040 RepID=A0ABU0PA93_9MICO|nr:extracellular solute-binding protein [Microbacterium murale]MDQ0643601.1 multiple sugar transport system substrate-binding protein [Microbacterium murale]
MRLLRTGIGVAAVALLLTGCASGANSGSGEVDTSLDPADISGEISYAIWDVNQQPAMEELIADFNKTYPDVDVSVELTAYAQYFTKLQTQGSSDTLPDVFWMNGPNFQLFASNGLLAPVTPLEDAGLIDPADYPAAMNDIYTLDGVQYAVPKDFDTIAVFYNRDIFARAGVAEPTSDWTWDDYHATAKQISDALAGEGIFGSGDGFGTQETVYPSILSNGGTIIEDGESGYDSPEAIEALQFWTDMVADGSMPSPAQNADTTGLQRFLNGQAGMLWTGNWQVSGLLESPVADDVTAVEIPLAPSGERVTGIHGIGNAMSAKAADDPAAQAFLAYLGSEEAAVIQAELGVANPAFNGTQQTFVDSVPEYNLQIFEDAAADYSVAHPVSLNTGAWNKLETDLLPEAYSGERPVAEVAKDLAEQMNQALAKEK